MASLYKQRDVWYLNLTIHNQRFRKSLYTNHLPTAKKLAKKIEPELIRSILVGDRYIWGKDKPDNELIRRFLEANHNWSRSTYTLYAERFGYYQAKGLPDNPSTRAMTIRCLNRMYKWAYEEKLISSPKKLDGGSRWEYRMRTFTKDEMDCILNEVTPYKFQLFVRFAYYTGARRGEIACLREENITEEYVCGKSGKRKIKLNSQAISVIEELDELWAYNPSYISQRFKKNLRRLKIKNGRFHDIRRTFGLNLIKQGMPIYEVSKLLGHSSVRTTEKHYAPLLITDIKDFIL